jgi:hypothetical protein
MLGTSGMNGHRTRRDLMANMIGHWFVAFIGNMLPRLFA